jgi:hypothetical protein
LTYQPTANWTTQFSAGRIEQPETHHADDIVRTTASVHHTRRLGNRDWSSSVIWARNHKTIAQLDTQAVLVETAVPFLSKNAVVGRFELSERDELFEFDHELAQEVFDMTGKRAFTVGAYTLGYTREIGTLGNVNIAIGANVTTHSLADALKLFYGNRPVGASAFLRFRLTGE